MGKLSKQQLLKTLFQDNVVLNHLAGVGIDWIFNIERAPWWGGVFERMVKSTKRCLKKMIGQAKLSLDEVHTSIVEIESIINSRPLSYLSSGDLEEPLTPSHLMVGRRIFNLPDDLGHLFEPGDEEFTTDPTQLRKRTKHLNNTLNHLWRRGRSEYLVELRESHRQIKHNLPTQPSISPGAVVIIHDERILKIGLLFNPFIDKHNYNWLIFWSEVYFDDISPFDMLNLSY